MSLSVIVPVYNEEHAVVCLYHAIRQVMESLRDPYEIIFVNDGSGDGTFAALKGIDLTPAHLIIVSFHQHQGKSAALQAGFDLAKGDILVTLDGDLQNDPQDIPLLLEKFAEGYDVVCGWRKRRRDSFFQTLPSFVGNKIRRIVFGERVHDVGCTLRAFKKSVLQDIYFSGGYHRFFTLIMLRRGYRITEVPVRHYPRRFGRSRFRLAFRLREGWGDMLRLCRHDVHDLLKFSGISPARDIVYKP